MISTRTTLRKDLSDALRRIAAQTEGTYLSLSATYPELLRQMRASINASGAGTEQSKDSLRTKEIVEHIHQASVHAMSLGTEIHTAHAKDVVVHQTLRDHMERIATLETHITSIQEESSAMELISLNAMTVALKAGASGRAFSFITEELKRLSTRTIELTRTVAIQGNSLLELLEQFSLRLETASAEEDRINISFRQTISAALGDFARGVEDIQAAFGRFRHRADGVFVPLMKIMEEIQKQDLIRQSIDHVVLSLDGIQDLGDDASDEEILDELSFMKSLPGLCRGVLEDINSMVAESLGVFRQELGRAESEISALERERESFVKQALDPRIDGSMESRFHASRELMLQVRDDLERVLADKRATVGISRDLVKQVRALDGILKTFSNLVTRFHTIDVASRIEIAKQEVLKQMSGTVDEMTKLTEHMEEEVEESLKVTSDFMSEATRSLDLYRMVFNNQTYRSGQLLDGLWDSMQAIERSKDEVVRSLTDFRVFTQGFTQGFDTSRQEINKLESLLETMGEIDRKLDDISRGAAEALEEELARTGHASWEMHNERIKTLIQKFTMFTHKKIAGDLAGFQVEEGIASGEVTLF